MSRGQCPAVGQSRYPAAALWGLTLAFVFILYETTIPFHFQFSLSQLQSGWERAVLAVLQGPGGVLSSRSDILGNVALFCPLGFFLTLSPVLLWAGRWRPLLLVLAGLLTSLAVETLQLFSPERWTQTNDLLTNTIGTLAGVAVAIAAGRDLFDQAWAWALQKLREEPPALILVLLTAVILLGALLPLDLSISRRSLLNQLLTARLDPLTRPPEGWWVAGLGLVKQGWLFAFWGVAAAYRLADRRRPWLQLLGWAALLSLVAEGSHIFVQSRSLSVLAFIVNWCGAGLGAAALLTSRRLGLGGRNLTVALATGYVIYLVADSLSPLATTAVRSFLSSGTGTAATPSGALPLLPPRPWQTLMELGDGLARLMRFVPLGLALRLSIRGVSIRLLTAVLAAGAVLVLELLVWRYSPWSGNLIEVLLAWAGLAAGWAGGVKVARYRSVHRFNLENLP